MSINLQVQQHMGLWYELLLDHVEWNLLLSQLVCSVFARSLFFSFHDFSPLSGLIFSLASFSFLAAYRTWLWLLNCVQVKLNMTMRGEFRPCRLLNPQNRDTGSRSWTWASCSRRRVLGRRRPRLLDKWFSIHFFLSRSPLWLEKNKGPPIKGLTWLFDPCSYLE